MSAKIGFVGAGRMAGAMIRGLIEKGVYKPDEIVACAPSEESRRRVEAAFGVRTYVSASEVASEAGIIVLAVKPKQVPALFEEEGLKLCARHLVISIMAGIRNEVIHAYVPDARIIRVMPNHCCSVLEGASGYVRGPNASDADMAIAKKILSALGLAVEVGESDLDAVTGVSGSSPAFIYMMIRAITDAGVLNGLDRETASRLAAQSMIGAGKMVLESGKTPEELVDGVCSPGGTTIEGVKVLRDKDFENIVIDAVNASIKKSKTMGGR